MLCSSFDDVLGFFHLQAAQQTLGNPVGDWPSHCDGSSEEDHGKNFLYSVNSLGTVSHWPYGKSWDKPAEHALSLRSECTVFSW